LKIPLAQEHRISAVSVSQDPGRFEDQKGSAAGDLQVQVLGLLIQVGMSVIADDSFDVSAYERLRDGLTWEALPA
jgi:hypothetical protein